MLTRPDPTSGQVLPFRARDIEPTHCVSTTVLLLPKCNRVQRLSLPLAGDIVNVAKCVRVVQRLSFPLFGDIARC